MEFKDFEKYKVKIFSSEVADGQMALETDAGRENAKKFLSKIGAEAPLAHMAQVYSNRIQVITKPGLYENIDGILTRENLALGVKASDCIPVMIHDPVTGLIGAIHCGREPLTKKILSNSLLEILSKTKVNPENLRVFLGPHIRVDSYPMKEGSIKALQGTKWEKYLKPRSGELNFDLTEGAKDELVKTGVLAENIYDSGIDTFQDGRFFSFRKKPDSQKYETTNFLTVIFK
jgi:copper oxidase (laccase) domain-containing protein